MRLSLRRIGKMIVLVVVVVGGGGGMGRQAVGLSPAYACPARR
jgi:hypothetical protein